MNPCGISNSGERNCLAAADNGVVVAHGIDKMQALSTGAQGMKNIATGLLLLVAAQGTGLFLGGCQRTLFSDSDRYSESKLKYFGGDSAEQTSESRKRNSEMGFGLPTGPASQ